MTTATPVHRKVVYPVVLVLLGAGAVQSGSAQDAPSRREFSVKAQNYAYNPANLAVQRNDVVKVLFHAEDIPHSFTVDAYRIAKRAAAGQTVVFEFHADQPGTFPIYCNLTADQRCKEMHGELVVH
jgi:heme/copper-type cytochrome/quinol oxidase subunit 2